MPRKTAPKARRKTTKKPVAKRRAAPKKAAARRATVRRAAPVKRQAPIAQRADVLARKIIQTSGPAINGPLLDRYVEHVAGARVPQVVAFKRAVRVALKARGATVVAKAPVASKPNAGFGWHSRPHHGANIIVAENGSPLFQYKVKVARQKTLASVYATTDGHAAKTSAKIGGTIVSKHLVLASSSHGKKLLRPRPRR